VVREPAVDLIPGPDIQRRRLASMKVGYPTFMLYTILIILAIVALLLFIFGRRRA
jgi:hypothetical protein